jgi:hypothetical protein
VIIISGFHCITKTKDNTIQGKNFCPELELAVYPSRLVNAFSV